MTRKRRAFISVPLIIIGTLLVTTLVLLTAKGTKNKFTFLSRASATCDSADWTCGPECASAGVRKIFTDTWGAANAAAQWRSEAAKVYGSCSNTTAPTLAPQCSVNKLNDAGACDPACCETGSDCNGAGQEGQKCNQTNGYCKTGKSCGVGTVDLPPQNPASPAPPAAGGGSTSPAPVSPGATATKKVIALNVVVLPTTFANCSGYTVDEYRFFSSVPTTGATKVLSQQVGLSGQIPFAASYGATLNSTDLNMNYYAGVVLKNSAGKNISFSSNVASVSFATATNNQTIQLTFKSGESCPSAGAPASTATVSISADKSSVALNETVMISVRVNNVENLQGAKINLVFDKSNLQVMSAEYGSFLSPDVSSQHAFSNDLGTITYAANQQNRPTAVGSGNLLTVVVKAIKAGAGNVRFADTNGFVLLNHLGATIPTGSPPGLVNIQITDGSTAVPPAAPAGNTTLTIAAKVNVKNVEAYGSVYAGMVASDIPDSCLTLPNIQKLTASGEINMEMKFNYSGTCKTDYDNLTKNTQPVPSTIQCGIVVYKNSSDASARKNGMKFMGGFCSTSILNAFPEIQLPQLAAPAGNTLLKSIQVKAQIITNNCPGYKYVVGCINAKEANTNHIVGEYCFNNLSNRWEIQQDGTFRIDNKIEIPSNTSAQAVDLEFADPALSVTNTELSYNQFWVKIPLISNISLFDANNSVVNTVGVFTCP